MNIAYHIRMDIKGRGQNKKEVKSIPDETEIIPKTIFLKGEW